MATLIKRNTSKAAKIVGASFFVFLMFFNVKIAFDDKPLRDNTVKILGIEIKLDEAKAAGVNLEYNEYKLSYGMNCPSYCGPGDYWASCHLPGSECGITNCGCYDFPD